MVVTSRATQLLRAKDVTKDIETAVAICAPSFRGCDLSKAAQQLKLSAVAVAHPKLQELVHYS